MAWVRWAWNLLLAIAAAFVCFRILPFVAYQWTALPWNGPPSFLARCIMTGSQGVGLAALAVLGFASLGTWAWRPVPTAARWAYAVAAVVMLVGTAVAEAVDRWDMVTARGRTLPDFGYIQFALCVSFVAFPIVLRGTGYPGLLMRLIGRRGDMPSP